MSFIKKYTGGVLLAAALAAISLYVSSKIPNQLISGGVLALLIGMLLNPMVSKYINLEYGLSLTSKKLLRLSIISMGATLRFSQVLEVGKFSLIVTVFTLITAFGGGYLIGKLFNMDWKLSGLISAGTGICGGSAVAAIAPVIDAKDSDIAYAISATFIFDVVMVVIFPIMGKYFGMTDLGFGLWAGTAVNDTSSVVAAGYAFSDAAGSYSVIVKLTRTLSIIPAVLTFSYINERLVRNVREKNSGYKVSVDIKKIFPWFILMFLAVVAVNSTGMIPEEINASLSTAGKFIMVMSLGAIGLKTNFAKLSKSGFAPMVHGFIISALVVIVSFLLQLLLGQV